MVICVLGEMQHLHMFQLMPLPLTISCFSKSRLVVPFWYWLTQVVLDIIHKSRKTVVVVVVVVVLWQWVVLPTAARFSHCQLVC